MSDNGGIVIDENVPGLTAEQSAITKLDRIYNDNPNSNNRAYKLLGVYLDEHLSFDFHCNHVCAKIVQANYILCRAKSIVSTKNLKTLYYALVHPHFLYFLPIYGCTRAKNINNLLKLQKKSIRMVCKAELKAPTQTLFKSLQIIPINVLIEYVQSLLIHSILHKHSPKYLHNMWIMNIARQGDLS